MSRRIIEAAKHLTNDCDAPDDAEFAKALSQLAELVNDPDLYSTDREIQAARDRYADDDITVDEGACASRGEDGVWVQAWVFLPNGES